MPPLTTVDPPTQRPSAYSTDGCPIAIPPPPSRYSVRRARPVPAVKDSVGWYPPSSSTITSTPASASSAAMVAPPAPDPTITAPHWRDSSPVTSSCLVSPLGMVMAGPRPRVPKVPGVCFGRADLRAVGLKAAPGDGRNIGGRVVADLPLDLGQLVVAHGDHALEPPDHLGRDVVPGQQRPDVGVGHPVVQPGEPPAPGRRIQPGSVVEEDQRGGQRLPGRGRQRAEHQRELAQDPVRPLVRADLGRADDLGEPPGRLPRRNLRRWVSRPWLSRPWLSWHCRRRGRWASQSRSSIPARPVCRWRRAGSTRAAARPH